MVSPTTGSSKAASGQAALAAAADQSALAPLFGGPTTSASPVVPPVIQKLDAQVQATGRTVFNGLLNWVSTLPVNSVTSWFEGGLLLMRKSLFNQTPSISAYQTVNTSALVKGYIDVVDPEGDPYKVEVVTKPSQGKVTLETTSGFGPGLNVPTTKYTYTPGADYTGTDQFVVKVSAPAKSLNVLHPFGVLNDRYYTVQVGDTAASETALGSEPKDNLDTSVRMANAVAKVTVKKQGLLSPSYTASVTLSPVSAARDFAWMDSRTRTGSVSVDSLLTKHWDGFSGKAAENGTQPQLMFKYADKGLDRVVLVDVAKVSKNADGSYTFTGKLTDDAPAQEGRVDKWDYIGIDYKSDYESFLNSTGLKSGKAGNTVTVTAVGTLGLTTYSPSAAVQAGYHDYALPDPAIGSATQTSPGSMGPGTVPTNSDSVQQGNGLAENGNTSSADSVNLTAMIPWGSDGSFITATNLWPNGTGPCPSDGTTGGCNGVYLYQINATSTGAQSSTGAAQFASWGSQTPSTQSGSLPSSTNNGSCTSACPLTPTQLAGSGWNAAVNVMAEWDQPLTDQAGNPIPVSYTGSLQGGVLTFTGSNFPQGGPVSTTYTGTATSNLPSYTLTGSAVPPAPESYTVTGYISDGAQPAVFTGSIDGTTLNANTPISGTIGTSQTGSGDVYLSGPGISGDVLVLDGPSGGGAGTYSLDIASGAGQSSGAVSPNPWPQPTGWMVAYNPNYPAANNICSIPATAPANLTGASVTGPGVAPGTVVTGQQGNVDIVGPGETPIPVYQVVVNNSQSVAGPLTFSIPGSGATPPSTVTVDGIIGNGTPFVGSISGTTLTVESIPFGPLTSGSAISASPGQVDASQSAAPFATGIAGNTTVTGQSAGATGGAGTYTVSQSQTWPQQIGTLVAGTPGSTITVELPAGVDGPSLSGASITGPGVPAGTYFYQLSPPPGDPTGTPLATITSLSSDSQTCVENGSCLANVLASGPFTITAPVATSTTTLTLEIPITYDVSGIGTPTIDPASLVGYSLANGATISSLVSAPIPPCPGECGSAQVNGLATATYQLNQAIAVSTAQPLTLSAPNSTSMTMAGGNFDPTAVVDQQIDAYTETGQTTWTSPAGGWSAAGLPNPTITGYQGNGVYSISTPSNFANLGLTVTVPYPGSDSLFLAMDDQTDPAGLVGGGVGGAGVPAGTTITAFNGAATDSSGNPLYDATGNAIYNFTTSAVVVAPALQSITVTAPTQLLALSIPAGTNPGTLIGQTISGASGIPSDTTINGYAWTDGSTVFYTLSNAINPGAGSFTVTTPNVNQMVKGLVVGLSDGSVQYWNGRGCSQDGAGTANGSSTGGSCTPEASGSAGQYGAGWTQLIASNGAGWGANNPVNTIAVLPGNQGFVVGLGDGSVQLWNSQILTNGTIVPGSGAGNNDAAGTGCGTSSPQGCWIQLQAGGSTGAVDPGAGWGSGVNVMITSGQNGVNGWRGGDYGGIVVGLENGAVYQWDGVLPAEGQSTANWTQLQALGQGSSGFGNNANVQTMLPYDGVQLIGAIGGSPSVANNGVISSPSYLPDLAGSAALSAATGGCTSTYNSGQGVGCSGYVLTVQSVDGPSGSTFTLQPGMTLYGGAGLSQGTTITQQISDAEGNLCAQSCTPGGAGVYFVNTPQLVAPGTPMSASNGTGFIMGLNNGSMFWWDSAIQNTTSLTPGAFVNGENDGCGITTTGNCWVQLAQPGWSAFDAMIPWRDGVVAGLSDGSVQFWSPQTQSYPYNASQFDTSASNANSTFGGTVQLLKPQSVTQQPYSYNGSGDTCDFCNPDPVDGEQTVYQAVTAMMPMGDGFVIGTTAVDPYSNGTIAYFTGFGPVSMTNAFGYYTDPNTGSPVEISGTSSTPEATLLPALNGTSFQVQEYSSQQPFYSWTTIANGPASGVPPCSNTSPGSPGCEASNATSTGSLSGTGAWPSNSQGSIQQFVPWSYYTKDSAGNIVLAQSVIAGQTSNGIWAWTGSTQNPLNPPNVANQPNAQPNTPWIEIQQNDNGAKPTLSSTQLDAAWGYAYQLWSAKLQTGCNTEASTAGIACTSQLPAFGTPGGVGAPYTPADATTGTPASGDPIFSLPANQAYCAPNCSSSGDLITFAGVHPFGNPNPQNPGVIWTLGDQGITVFGNSLPCNTAICNTQLPLEDPSAVPADPQEQYGASVNLMGQLAYYGYAFVPSGTWDKLDPSKYAVGALVAGLTGPQIVVNSNNFNIPAALPGQSQNPYVPLAGYSVNDGDASFSVNAGVQLNAGVSGRLGVPAQDCSNETENDCSPFELAHAYLVPGLLITKGVAGYSDFALASSMAYDAGVADASDLYGTLSSLDLQLSAGVTPQLSATIGAGPSTFPILDFSGTLGFPVSGNVLISCGVDTGCVNAENQQIAGPQVSVNTSADLNVALNFLPKIGGGLPLLNKTFQIFSVTDCFVNCSVVSSAAPSVTGSAGGPTPGAAAAVVVTGPSGSAVSRVAPAGAVVAAGSI